MAKDARHHGGDDEADGNRDADDHPSWQSP
jgi:hypothetical protein